ncbi:DUF2771 family protein [Tomitella cavernea]|uniref:DUF2771 domain-containing protein n=1 Tax=Tomitella cavernea TaxID=1387982 RepID=A0ABP9CJ97_9ACTN|nr:DUF2771 family protein [Tomitella cavernea]
MSTTDARTRRSAKRPRRVRSRRTRLILRSLIAVVAVAAVVGVTFLVLAIVTDDTVERPVVTATAGDRTVEVEPFEWCDPQTPTECDTPGETADIPVREGTPLVIDVPDAIAKAPWSLKRYYVDPGVVDGGVGSLIPEEQIFTPGSTRSITVPPVNPDGNVLAGVEITLPTGIIDQATGDVTYIDHATWSIKTR